MCSILKKFNVKKGRTWRCHMMLNKSVSINNVDLVIKLIDDFRVCLVFY